MNQLTESVRLQKRYIVMLKAQIRDPQKVGLDLAACLSELVVSFSRTAAEVAALADAGYYDISEDLLNEDKEKLIELGSFQALVDYHNNKQKNIRKSEHWWTRDTAADFQPFHRTAKFRNLQIRILQVYKKAAAGMHAQNAGHPLLDCSKLCTRRDPIELRGDERSRGPKIPESKAPNN